MKVKRELLLKYLKKNGMSAADLAHQMGVSLAEVEKMLSGETVGVNTARKFIRYFTADEAQRLIDWEAIGKENPLACEADYLPADNEQPDNDYDDEENCFDGEDELFDEATAAHEDVFSGILQGNNRNYEYEREDLDINA